MSRRSPALLLIAALATARAASAQGGAGPGVGVGPADTLVDDASEKERNTLYREGVAAAEAGRWGEALERFQRVVALRSAPRALLALAAAEENVGRLVSALRTYGEARDDARAQQDEALAGKAEAALAALAPRLPKLALTLPPEVTGAEARLDGALIEISARGIDVDPGVYRLVVTAPGRQTFEERLAIAAGQRREVAVTFTSTRAPGSALSLSRLPGQAEPAPRTGPPLATWILGGAGLAAAAAGLIVRLQGQSVYDNAKAAHQIDRGNDARDRMIVGTIIAGAGLTLAGVGAVWWVVAPSAKVGETWTAVGGRF